MRTKFFQPIQKFKSPYVTETELLKINRLIKLYPDAKAFWKFDSEPVTYVIDEKGVAIELQQEDWLENPIMQIKTQNQQTAYMVLGNKYTGGSQADVYFTVILTTQDGSFKLEENHGPRVCKSFRSEPERVMEQEYKYTEEFLKGSSFGRCFVNFSINNTKYSRNGIDLSFLSGSLLSDSKSEVEKLSVNEVLILAKDLAQQIQVMHDKGYYHGDNHNSNIMYNPDEKKATYFDFGKTGKITNKGKQGEVDLRVLTSTFKLIFKAHKDNKEISDFLDKMPPEENEIGGFGFMDDNFEESQYQTEDNDKPTPFNNIQEIITHLDKIENSLGLNSPCII